MEVINKTLEEQLIEKERELDELRKKIEANKPKPITERVKGYLDVLDILKVDESKDKIEIYGFDEAENKVVKTFIKKMRITKVYREGWIPKRGERRYYPYFDVSSGFAFYYTDYGGTGADTASASRLCLPNEETTRDYASKFIDVERDLIDLP